MRIASILMVLLAIFAGARWTMWAFTTDQPWYVRSIIGCIFVVVLLGGLPQLYGWAKEKVLSIRAQ